MRTRGTLIILALFLLVASYAYFFERKQAEESEQGAGLAVVLDLDPAAISGFRFTLRDSAIALARRDGRWFLIEPLEVLADESAVTKLTNVFDQLRAERTLPLAELDSVATGLADPWMRVTVIVADSKQHELAVGALNPLATAYYARIDGGAEISLIGTCTVDSKIKPTVLHLRDRKLVRFDPEAVRRIELTGPDRHLELLAGDAGWRIAVPPLLADTSAVHTLIQRLGSLEASAVEHEAPRPVDFARCGLDRPSLTAVIRDDRDSVLARMGFGSRTPRSGYFQLGSLREEVGRFAMGSAQSAILIVPEFAAAELSPSVFDLREKHLLDLGTGQIDSLTVIGGGRMVLAARDSAGHFHRKAATSDRAPVGDPEIDRIAASLPHVIVSQFASEAATEAAELRPYGLEAPYLRLRLRLHNGEVHEVLFGDADPTGLGVYARRSARPEVVVVGHAIVGDLVRLVFGEDGRKTAPTSSNPPPAGRASG